MILSDSEKPAALKRALMRVKPEYFSWPIEAQEKYRVAMPDMEMFRIRQALLKALFSISVNTEDEMNKAFDAFNDEQYLLFNSTLLPLAGIGEDKFFLNEHLGDKTLLDFETLYDPQMDFIFSDKTALQAVRFRHFMKDCREIMGDAQELDTLVEQERHAIFDYLERMHQDILHNFDPKVIRFRKKRKVILADEALKDLL